jgi:YegS/Rv2252/BmrU family lipid kinase
MTSSPFGPLRLIVNPHAGRGAIERGLPAIEDVLREEDLAYDIARTAGPGDATRLAREALAEGIRYIVAVGGDGTAHEVVNGMMGDDAPLEPDAVLGLIPSGSGCDLTKTFGIRPEPGTAARGLAGKTLWGRLDIGRVRYRAPDGSEASRWFVNIAEAGIGAAVVRTAARMPRWLGGRAYRLAALRGIASFRPREASLVMNARKARGSRPDAPLEQATHTGTVTMVVVANCQFFGGGLRVAPRAIPSDGMLDVLVGEGTKLQALTALRKMPLGQHVPGSTFTEYLADRVSLEGSQPLAVEADGEFLGTTPATFDLVPAAIQLKV